MHYQAFGHAHSNTLVLCNIRSKLDEMVISPTANKLVKQRLCLLLASMAASDGADTGLHLVHYAAQLAQSAGASQVTCGHADNTSARTRLHTLDAWGLLPFLHML